MSGAEFPVRMRGHAYACHDRQQQQQLSSAKWDKRGGSNILIAVGEMEEGDG